ncbi:MAG: hypothetical protein D6812_00125 [Deltaproteobacteria bacterium]|nr:MAG: hypothetical protein D6812_00125 [Deltaproteobacteria bacterium]
MKIHAALLIFPSLLICGIVGCATSRQAGWERAAQTSAIDQPSDAAVLMAQADQAWEGRDTRQGLLQAIDAYERVLVADAHHKGALTRLSRAYYFLADGYTEDPEEKKRLWEKGTTYGERALGTSPEFLARVKETGNVGEAVQILGMDYIAPIYWTATNLGKWARLEGFTTMLKYKKQIKGMIERVTALDETFFYGAPHRYWGAYYAVAPSFAGGDMRKSEASFRRALEIEPNYFGTRVLFADYYARKAGDRALFEEMLRYVLEGDPKVLPDIVPEQKVEQEKARRLMARIDEFFEPDEAGEGGDVSDE